MQRIVKNTLLKYVKREFFVENLLNTHRVFDFNNKKIKEGNVVYLIEREVRVKDNFALQFCVEQAQNLNSALKIIHPKIYYENCSKQNFIYKQIEQIKNEFYKNGYDFKIYEDNKNNILNYLQQIKTGLLIIDFNPIQDRSYLKNAEFKIYEIDGHNIIPARFISNKQEYNAATLRRKIYHNIYPFLTEYKYVTDIETEADIILNDFIQKKLPHYAEFKNNPTKNVLSGLSKYLNLGFISSQRVAIEVIKSNVSNINKEVFLEELIVRKELADNFCLYCKNYKTFEGIPAWAKNSLNMHKNDIKDFFYTKEELENCNTFDNLWNATQAQLKKEGVIHGYLRMYWAKKILEWMQSPEIALETANYLNDKYAFDSPSPNGYTGILWALGGLHDRAFQDYYITGKIRRMSYNSIKKKFNISEYIDTYFFNKPIRH